MQNIEHRVIELTSTGQGTGGSFISLAEELLGAVVENSLTLSDNIMLLRKEKKILTKSTNLINVQSAQHVKHSSLSVQNWYNLC